MQIYMEIAVAYDPQIVRHFFEQNSIDNVG